jgi:8-oxo-dGTP pyrophosphatase MutT (NUDIX family)
LSRFRAAVAVYGLLRRDGMVLLLRRKGSGYRDGLLSLPAGHLEGEEDAVSGLRRELREELGIDARQCELALVMHRRRESADDHEYLDLFFEVAEWTGEPVIGEPEKCSELVWVCPRELPADVVDYIAVALKAKGGLVIHGWG